MMVVDYIFATYLIVFEFKEFSPFLNLFMILAFLYNLCVNHYLFCYQSILSGCKKTQKSVCIEREEDSSQQPIKQFFPFIFFPIVQISSQKLANVSFSCQDSGTFALAHINFFIFFSLFLCFECSWTTNSSLFNKQLPHIKFFPYQSIFFFDFTAALHLYLLIKHWQVSFSKCSNIVFVDRSPFAVQARPSQDRHTVHASRGIQEGDKWGFRKQEWHYHKKCNLFSALAQTLDLCYPQKISCRLHPFNTSPWNLDHFKLYNGKIICYQLSDLFKRLSLSGSWAIRGCGRTWTDGWTVDGCVCTYTWSSFVPSRLALVVKTTISVISWLALQGKEIFVLAAGEREVVIMLLSLLTDRHLYEHTACFISEHSLNILTPSLDQPTSTCNVPCFFYQDCNPCLLFLLLGS